MRLAINEANFTYRVSATLLMCNVYHKAGPNKDKIRQYLMIDSENSWKFLIRRCSSFKESPPPKFLTSAKSTKSNSSSQTSSLSSSTAPLMNKIKLESSPLSPSNKFQKYSPKTKIKHTSCLLSSRLPKISLGE